MKVAPVVAELSRLGIDHLLVHTGQHYDEAMSASFFADLDLPEPDVHLGVGSDTHARQTAKIMCSFEPIALERRPDLVMVAGDVNSTIAVALVCAKLEIPVAHLEAGLRSYDRGMPEEVNRVLTDHLSDLLFATEPSAIANLASEGIAGEDRVFLVGNCMIDTLLKHRSEAVTRAPWIAFGLLPNQYAVLTMHRPANVDDPSTLVDLLRAIAEGAEDTPVLFAVHPRTRARLADAHFSPPPNLLLLPPQPYKAFLGLMASARLVLTDSGGIQEETTILGVQCLTIRDNTERPITLTHGTNRLIGTRPSEIRTAVAGALKDSLLDANRSHPPLWDGSAAYRVAAIIQNWLRSRSIASHSTR